MVTGGPTEYWVLATAVALLVLGCWMAGQGGITGQVSQSLALRSGAVATYNANGDRNVYAEIVGVWADDRSSADGRYLILGTDDQEEFYVTDGAGVYHTGDSMAVDRLTVEVGEAASRQMQTLTFNDEEPGPQLQQLMVSYPGQQIYLSGTLTVDYPEEIALAPGRGIETATLTGSSLKMTYHPLNLALVQLSNQWVTGYITVQIQ